MIGLDGEKMSKSRGNLVFVSKLRGGGVDPMAIRLALMDGHYRADRELDGRAIAQGRGPVWRAGAQPRRYWPRPMPARLLASVRAALADDLDTATAIAAVDDWAEATLANAGGDAEAPGLVRDLVDALLGIAL